MNGYPERPEQRSISRLRTTHGSGTYRLYQWSYPELFSKKYRFPYGIRRGGVSGPGRDQQQALRSAEFQDSN